MTKPTILAFDTSAAHCAAALMVHGDIVTTRREAMNKGQAERLMLLLQEVLDEHGCVWDELDAVAVGIGPGNFTGIRIGVSAARGLALGLGKPAIGISTFDAIWDVRRPKGQVTIAVPGPAGAFYLQSYLDGVETDPPLIAPSPARGEGWGAARLECLVDDAYGSTARDAQRISDVSGPPGVYHSDFSQHAMHIAQRAALRLEQGALARPAPLYIKPADAAPSKTPAPVILT